jgi:hypothetical protein
MCAASGLSTVHNWMSPRLNLELLARLSREASKEEIRASSRSQRVIPGPSQDIDHKSPTVDVGGDEYPKFCGSERTETVLELDRLVPGPHIQVH